MGEKREFSSFCKFMGLVGIEYVKVSEACI